MAKWHQRLGLFLTLILASSLSFAAMTTPSQTPPHLALAQHKQLWNLKDADIRAVIHTISILTGKNFLIDPNVQGKITLVTQKPMTPNELYQVFLSMLQSLNYAAIPNGKIIKIVPAMQAKQFGPRVATKANPGAGDEVVVRVIPINNTSAMQLVPILQPLMQQWGSVSAYAPSNALILTGTAENISRLAQIVHNMDGKNASFIRMMHLKHANAKHIVDVISHLQNSDRSLGKTSNVSLAADSDDNSILISANATNQIIMQRLIRSMDTTSNNTSNQTKVVMLHYLEAKKLAPVLTKLVSHGELGDTTTEKTGSSTPTTPSPSRNAISIAAEENTNAIIINAPQDIVSRVSSVIRKLDTRPRQVLVEAVIVKMDEALLNQLGVVWGTVDDQGNPTGSLNGSPGANTFALKVNHGIGFIQNGNLEALVHALAQDSATNILARPSITVLNNTPATIADGKNIGIINRQYATNIAASADSSVPFNTIQRKDVTLSLSVTPQISTANTLRLKIKQQDNTLDANGSQSSDNPTFDTSKITTSVLVKSGNILVLGGLINNDQIRSTSKIPILGDIPLLGNLFRYKNRSVEKKYLMAFIRPVILNSDYRMNKETSKRYNHIRQEQLQAQKGHLISSTLTPVLPALPAPKHTYDK